MINNMPKFHGLLLQLVLGLGCACSVENQCNGSETGSVACDSSGDLPGGEPARATGGQGAAQEPGDVPLSVRLQWRRAQLGPITLCTCGVIPGVSWCRTPPPAKPHPVPNSTMCPAAAPSRDEKKLRIFFCILFSSAEVNDCHHKTSQLQQAGPCLI